MSEGQGVHMNEDAIGATTGVLRMVRIAEVAESAAAHATAIGVELGQLKRGPLAEAMARLCIMEGRVPAQPPEWKRQYELLAGRVSSLESGKTMPADLRDTVANVKANLEGHLRAHAGGTWALSGRDADESEDDDQQLVELLKRCRDYLASAGAPKDAPKRAAGFRACYHALMAELERTLADLE